MIILPKSVKLAPNSSFASDAPESMVYLGSPVAVVRHELLPKPLDVVLVDGIGVRSPKSAFRDL